MGVYCTVQLVGSTVVYSSGLWT